MPDQGQNNRRLGSDFGGGGAFKQKTGCNDKKNISHQNRVGFFLGNRQRDRAVRLGKCRREGRIQRGDGGLQVAVQHPVVVAAGAGRDRQSHPGRHVSAEERADPGSLAVSEVLQKIGAPLVYSPPTPPPTPTPTQAGGDANFWLHFPGQDNDRVSEL